MLKPYALQALAEGELLTARRSLKLKEKYNLGCVTGFAILEGETMSFKTDSKGLAAFREQMVAEQICHRGINNQAVLDAMSKIPRHCFIDSPIPDLAYTDRPLSIGYNQTISQPYIVALMTTLAELSATDKVLEIGTGSGYQAAVLAEIVKEVYSVEIICDLADRAKKLLDELGYKNIRIKTGDGYYGWPEYAPYDAIIVTAASKNIPKLLLSQLKVSGKMVVPIGAGFQDLIVVTKTDKGWNKQVTIPVLFVPMTRRKSESGNN